jgi:hypothetical protein
MRKAALIALASAFCLGTAAPSVARGPDPPSHLTKKHGKKHHKAGNSGHEGRAPGAGH